MFCTSNLSVLCEIFCIHVEGGKGSSATECIDVFLKYLPTCDFPLGRSSLTGSELSSMLEGDDRFVMTWLETHDSMVLATKNGISSTYSLEFIYLDGWKNFVTSDISHGRRNTTISGNWNTLFLGQVPSDEDFSNKFFSATRLSDKVYKDTSALVSDLIKKLSNAFYLKLPDDKLDGLTTSRMPNKISTSWSLLKAAINIMIDQRLSGDVNHLRGEFLFERLEAGFYVWVLENILVTSPVKAEIIDTLMSAHRTASERCADLAEKNFDMSVVATRLETLSAKWERLAAKTTLAISTLLVDDANTTAWSHPVIVLPTETSQPLHSDPNIADVRRNIEANLGALRPFPAFPALPGHVLNWINSTAALPNHLQPMIRSVEHWFLEGALSLKVNSDKGYVCEDIYIADVESIMKLYRDSSAKFQLMAKKSKLPQPELKSLEILCVWIAFCMVHAAAVKRYPLLNHYDVALNGADLHHLVLSEKVAVDATLAVVSYLKKFSKSLPVIFSLSYQDGTMQFAKEYSSADVTMIRMYIKELEDAESKRNANYKIVLGKQKLAKTIRGEIEDAEQKIRKSELELLRSDGRERHYSNIIARYRGDIDNLKSRLGNALKSPPMVYQSLPRDKSGAMVNLFFIYMPKSLRTVFTLTALAKQMLVPRSSLSGSITGNKSLLIQIGFLNLRNRYCNTFFYRERIERCSDDLHVCQIELQCIFVDLLQDEQLIPDRSRAK